MTISNRLLAAALLATLAACGNKGPLVHPAPPADSTIPAPASPPSTDPTDTLPEQSPTPPEDTGTASPPAPPASRPAADDGSDGGSA